jgi:hypothetical protein
MPSGIYKRLVSRNWTISNEAKDKHRKAITGLHRSEESKLKNRLSHLGKKCSDITKAKIRLANTGDKRYNWKGGITPIAKQIRNCFKYRQWRSDVFTRDDFTCQKCNQRGGNLEAHHKKPFAKILTEYKIKTVEQAIICEELWNINNGETMCCKCHKMI